MDPGANETEVTRLALKHDLDWFEQQVIHTVPRRYPGRNRRVYPGLIQLGAFMSTQFTRHINQHMDLFWAVMRMREEDAQKITEFYDEYLAVQDLSADFYLDTLHRVFQRRDLPKGELDWHGRPIDPGAIETVRLVTIEGEKDDICAPGQTSATHALCRHLPDRLKTHHLQQGVGISGRSAARNTAPAFCRCSSGCSRNPDRLPAIRCRWAYRSRRREATSSARANAAA